MVSGSIIWALSVQAKSLSCNSYKLLQNVPRGTQVPLRYAIDAGGRRRRQDGFNIFHSVLRSAAGDEEDVVVLHGEVCVLG